MYISVSCGWVCVFCKFRTIKLKLVQMVVLKVEEVLTLTSAQAPLLAAAY